jgi:hypothetical protein
MRRSLLPVLVVAVLPLTTGCRVSVCGAAGADPGVGFTGIGNAFPDYHRQYHVRACVADECVDWTGIRSETYRLWVLLDFTTPTTVTATLTLTSTVDPTDVVFDDSAQVGLIMVQPNGPRCEPTAYQGQVEVTRDGDLVPRAFAG